MEKIHEYYMNCNIEELKKIENKINLINNDNKYEFVWFCQKADTNRIDTLLDKEGITILLENDFIILFTKLRGIISSKKEFNILKDERLCEAIRKKCKTEFLNFSEKVALDYIKYLYKNSLYDLIDDFSRLTKEAQKYVLKNLEFSTECLNKILYCCEKETAEYIFDTYPGISIEDISETKMNILAKKNIIIPNFLITPKLIDRLSNINNVNSYRFLINNLKNNIDVDSIEKKRKEKYLIWLNSIDKNGTLPINKVLNDEKDIAIKSPFTKTIDDYYNEYQLFVIDSEKKSKMIKQYNSYRISNIIIDYLFEDIPTNVIMDIKMLLKFQKIEQTLQSEDLEIYTKLANIDTLTTKQKLYLFNKLNGKDCISKFYDDYSKCKNKMINIINKSILNKENIVQYKNDTFSKQYGIPVYYFNGSKFSALVKSMSLNKFSILDKDPSTFCKDASSFSIDSSELLDTFRNPKRIL